MNKREKCTTCAIQLYPDFSDKELENQSINLRTRDNVVHGELALNVLHKIEQERSDYSLTSYFAEEVNA